jgi:hypothetical protein
VEAALAPLDLPPDGPIDPKSALRAKLMPDVAAGNFVCWAQALGLIGNYSKRSIYALYCEFSEVDQRPPIGEERFLEALKQTEYVRVERLRIACGNGKFRRPWQWTIELAPEIRALEFGDEAPGAVVELHRLGETASTSAEAPAQPAPVTRPIRPLIIRYVPDEGHPFSPAGLREKAKSARRLRLNTAASRKQRGALRRAA